MSNEPTRGYAAAVIALASGEGALDTVDNELLAVARAIDGDEQLRQTLTDHRLPIGQRLVFVESRVLEAAHPATRAALAMLIAADRVGSLGEIADEVASRAAAARDEEIAEVVVAVPLDDQRRAALKAALERAVGRPLELKIAVDERVVGGVRAQIGDTVIDGSLLRRLTDLRTRVGA